MKHNEPIKKLAILFAMEAEAKPTIEKLGMIPSGATFRFPTLTAYEKTIENLGTIYVVINGKSPTYSNFDLIGTQIAAIAALETITAIQPDLIISAGTAGGFEKFGTEVGDVFLSTGFGYHDRRIPLGDWLHFGRGNYSCPILDVLAKKYNLHLGKISTGNSLDFSDSDEIEFIKSDARLKEMEAAAIAEIATFYDVPVIALKAITNCVGLKANVASEFTDNFSIAVSALTEKLVPVCHELIGNALSKYQEGISHAVRQDLATSC